MGTLTSGGQRVKSECLEPLTVITSCVEPEVVTVKVEADYANVVTFFSLLTLLTSHLILCIIY